MLMISITKPTWCYMITLLTWLITVVLFQFANLRFHMGDLLFHGFYEVGLWYFLKSLYFVPLLLNQKSQVAVIRFSFFSLQPFLFCRMFSKLNSLPKTSNGLITLWDQYSFRDCNLYHYQHMWRKQQIIITETYVTLGRREKSSLQKSYI